MQSDSNRSSAGCHRTVFPGDKRGALAFCERAARNTTRDTGELVSSDFVPQAKQALKNLLQIVLAAGYNLNHVVAVDVFVTDLNNFATFNDIYAEYFSEHRPARAVVEVSRLPRDACIEIKCVACHP